MIPVNHVSPTLAWCLAKEVCSTKFYLASVALGVPLGATKSPTQ